MDAWQGCRFAVSWSRSALLATASAPIVMVQIARQAATANGEGSDGPGAAAQAGVDRRQRSPLYQDDTWRPLFAQLRRDDPVHYCEASPFGPYWSVTRYDDIFAVELDHENYSSSSELGGIQVADQPKGREISEFHPDGPARPHRAAPHRRADRGAVQSRQFRAADPQADIRRAGRAAAQRDLRLGRAGLDRSHQHDAGDAVRFSLGRSR